MDQRTTQTRNELQRSVVQHQEELQRAVGDLTSTIQVQLQRARHKIQQTRQQLDLPNKIKDRPWPWILGGFGVGFWLGARRRVAEMLHEAGF